MSSENTITFSQDGDWLENPDPGPERGSSTAESESATGQVFADRFEVVQPLGEGGMGQVFRVHDRQIEGRDVALKILHPRFSADPRFRGLFFQEVRAGQSFVSEHVVQVRDTGQMEDGRLFLTMDLVEGENLSTLLKREHSLDARHALEIARQALIGLKSGHEKGFIHRDIKPSNLMLRARVPKTERNPFGVQVLILDFGLANLAKELKTGQVAGTPFYMSPEQVRDERLDARSDLFAVAVVLYEMISGTRPFQGKTMHEITSSVIETDVSPMIASLEHLSPAIQKILARGLQKDREERFQSAGEFIEAIEGSKAYRLPTTIAPWLLFLTVGGTIAGGVEAVLLVQRESAVERLQGEQSQLRNVVSRMQQTIDEGEHGRSQLQSQHTATLAEKEAELNKARTGFDRIQADLNARLESINGDLAAAVAELESLRKKDLTSNTQAEDMQSQVNRLETARQESELRVTNLASDLREHESELARLREENEKLRLRAEPDAQRASGFDVFLRLIEERRGLAAWQKYSELEKELLGKGDAHGGDFVEALARAARELALYDDAGPGAEPHEARRLTEAARALAEAEKLLPVLATAGADWLGHRVTEREAPDRLARAKGALELLGTDLAGRQGEVSGAHASATEELRSLAPLEGPEAVLQHVARYGCDHSSPATERAAEGFSGALIALDGRLDVKKLRAAKALDDWGRALEDGRLPAGSAAARRLLGLWVARGWYDGGESRGSVELQRSVVGPADESREPEDLWRAVLALELSIDRGLQSTPDALPSHGGHGFALYRRSEAGTTRWFKESARLEGQEWTIQTELLSLDPLKPNVSTSAKVRRQGKLYDYRGWVLDLTASGVRASVEIWPLPIEPLPAGLESVLDHQSLTGFQAEEREAPHRCLVLEDRGIRRWFSPRLGLVREEEPGTFVKDLVYTNSNRP